MPWKRPESVSYPTVWGHYTGKRALPSGRIPQFRIQDAPEEMFEEIIDHMNTVFLKDEPICACTKLVQDPVSVQEIDNLWREALKEKSVLVALEVLEDGTTKLAGVNMTLVEKQKQIDDIKFLGGPMQLVLGVVIQMSKIADVYKVFGVTEYLSALGLSVPPEYRGHGLGLEILKARVPFCKAMGLKLTSTVFTADNSQELARRAGFEVMGVIDYATQKVNGKPSFPGLDGKLCKTMALKIESN